MSDDSTRSRWQVSRLALVASAFVVLLLVAGCGGGSSSTSGETSQGSETSEGESGGGGEEASAAVTESQEFFEEHLETPTEIFLTESVSKAPEPGKNIVYADCGAPICHVIGASVQEAVEAVGWNYKTVNLGGLPEQVSNAWDQIVQEEPDGVIGAGTPRTLFKHQFKELGDKNIPYVTASVPEEPAGAQIATITGPPDFVIRGQWMARWVVADSGGDANVVFVNLPEYPILIGEEEEFLKEFEHLCPECGVDVLPVSQTELGKEVPSKVVSYIQSHPDTNYMVGGQADTTLGVPQALRAASLNDVKIISQAGTPSNFENIADGTAEIVNVPEPEPMFGYTLVDALVRHYNGDSLPLKEYATLPRQYLTEENIADPEIVKNGVYQGVPGFREQYEQLWKLK